MYKNKNFRQRSLQELEAHLKFISGMYLSDARRAFIGDGDALGLKTDFLIQAFKQIKTFFPEVNKYGIYGSVFSLRGKSLEELEELRGNGLKYIYLGIESGDEEVLRKMNKFVARAEMIDSCRRVLEAKITLSVTIILGLGGIERSDEHIDASSDIINRIRPTHVSLLKLLLKHSPLKNDESFFKFDSGYYRREIERFIRNIAVRTIFRADHASNYLPLKGVLPRDREKLCRLLEEFY
jgi:radical SAM superfamily enzyme YgiQ (UPF0313 family)